MSQNRTAQSQKEVDEIIRAILEEANQIVAAAATEAELGADEGESAESAGAGTARRAREACQWFVDLAAGLTVARGIKQVFDTETVIKVARHVASKKTRNMTNTQVLEFIASNHGFRRSLGGHLFEALDERNLKAIYNLQHRLGLSEGRFLKLYSEHNRRGLDGAYKGAVRAGDALFAQHKASASTNQLRKAAAKAGKSVRAKTELVVPRGVHVDLNEINGLKRVRHAGPSLRELSGMVERAGDPATVRRTGAAAAEKLTLKCSTGTAAISAGVSFAFDLRKVRRTEVTLLEAAENALWSGGEAALNTAATAVVTVYTAPLIAAGVSVLAESTLLGTTVAAAGLATAGPVVAVVGTGLAVGYGVKKIRHHRRAGQSATYTTVSTTS